MSRMKLRVAIPVLVIGLFRAAVVQAHVAKKQLVAVRADFKAPQDSYNKLSDEQRKMLAGDALNSFRSAGTAGATIGSISLLYRCRRDVQECATQPPELPAHPRH